MTEITKLKRADKLAERRRSLVEAAVAAIAEKGLASVTVADVAKQAGCGYGLVLFHFGSKQNLLLTTLDDIMTKYREAWLGCAQTHQDVSAKLKALIDFDLGSETIDQRYIAVVSAFWAEVARNPEYRRIFQGHHVAYMKRLEPLVAELADLEPPLIEPGLIARGLSALVDGLWIESQLNGPYGQGDWATARRLTRAYLSAFFPRSFD